MALRAEDDPEFADLYRLVVPRLTRALTAGFAEADVADALQEAFIRAGVRWSRVATLEDPAGWIRRVALDLLINQRRTLRRRAAADLTLAGASEVGEPDAATAVAVRSAIAELSPRQRAVVTLRYFGDCPLSQIATDLCLSEGAVKRYLSDGRSKLREVLRDEGKW